ncbi:hypothetical protein KAU55_00530 [Candidatus Bathyarchaeota archaeon]|nr:hypothetical protein [Candidatus Bathyarchaeota archaeon]
METLKRRLDLLKLEGLGFYQPEITKELSDKYGVSRRTVQLDFATRSKWQPKISEAKDVTKTLMKITNRYEQIYRKASRLYLTGSNENTQLGALSIMDRVTGHLAEAVVIPDLMARLVKIEDEAKRKLRP